MSHIGQLNEQHLHAALKAYYAEPNAQVEVQVDGYIIDVVSNDQLIEIQTANFSTIKRKLSDLVHHHPVRLVYPIAAEKWLVKLPNNDCEDIRRRKSPKRGRLVDVFSELVSIPKLFLEPNFSLELILIQEEEVRRYIKKKRWRHKGWETVERRLIKILERKIFSSPDQLGALLPENLPESFTTTDIADGLDIPPWLAQKMAYCLREMGAINLIGKKGRSCLYSLTSPTL
jgi:hypothetical protein